MLAAADRVTVHAGGDQAQTRQCIEVHVPVLGACGCERGRGVGIA